MLCGIGCLRSLNKRIQAMGLLQNTNLQQPPACRQKEVSLQQRNFFFSLFIKI
jgi:hypothetical protein